MDATKGHRFLGGRPLGEISMLVSACRKIVSATSAVLCGFLFALRAYLCERSSCSFRSLLLPSASSSFSPLLPPYTSSFLLFLCPCHNRGGHALLHCRTLQMIRSPTNQSLESYRHDASPRGNFFRARARGKSHSNVQVYFCARQG